MTIGLILSLLALGVFISFRIFNVADITADGSITLGAAVSSVLLVAGVSPILATLAGACAGAVAGLLTGLLHTKFRIHGLLSGILVMTALYSINLRIMGKSNISLMSVQTLTGMAAGLDKAIPAPDRILTIWRWRLPVEDLLVLLVFSAIVLVVVIALYLFLRTGVGTALRATGDNAQMVRAQGTDTDAMTILGLGLGNFLAALSGSLLAQYQGFADVQMGIGMVVWGLASVIIGGSLVRSRRIGLSLAGAIMGSLIFRLLVANALRLGMDPNDLKLVTAIFVFAALVLPTILASLRAKRGGRHA
jgi:putative ABC transport system permease protein